MFVFRERIYAYPVYHANVITIDFKYTYDRRVRAGSPSAGIFFLNGNSDQNSEKKFFSLNTSSTILMKLVLKPLTI